VARIDDLLTTALKTLPTKPPDTATREDKRAYSGVMSAKVAVAIGAKKVDVTWTTEESGPRTAGATCQARLRAHTRSPRARRR
jgi:hypothetical protein